MEYMLKMKKPTDRRHRHLTFYRSKFVKGDGNPDDKYVLYERSL